MKILSVLTALTVLACQPGKTETAQKQTISENKVENSVVPTEIKPKDSSFKNGEGLKARIPEKDTLKKALTAENPFVEADASFQWDANQKLEKLLKHYGNNIPNYYSGAFINDKGNLVINIRENLQKGKSEVIKIIGARNVLFQNKTYSYKELNDIMNFLNEFAQNPQNRDKMKNVPCWSLMELENYVEVCMLENTPEKQAEFRKNVLDSDAIRFRKSGPMVFH